MQSITLEVKYKSIYIVICLINRLNIPLITIIKTLKTHWSPNRTNLTAISEIDTEN